MGFAAVARVTEDRWIACGVRDEIAFGLEPGSELKVETTICSEIRQSGEAVVIDHVAEDAKFCRHPTPAMYGFQSYISVPIVLPGRGFFGTLCAIDPRPARLNTPQMIGMFKLFAELIAFHLDALDRLATSAASLSDERRTAELREQFIAVLGHDLRNPLASIDGGTRLLGKMPLDEQARSILSDAQQRRAHGDPDRQRAGPGARPAGRRADAEPAGHRPGAGAGAASSAELRPLARAHDRDRLCARRNFRRLRSATASPSSLRTSSPMR